MTVLGMADTCTGENMQPFGGPASRSSRPFHAQEVGGVESRRGEKDLGSLWNLGGAGGAGLWKKPLRSVLFQVLAP